MQQKIQGKPLKELIIVEWQNHNDTDTRAVFSKDAGHQLRVALEKGILLFTERLQSASVTPQRCIAISTLFFGAEQNKIRGILM